MPDITAWDLAQTFENSAAKLQPLKDQLLNVWNAATDAAAKQQIATQLGNLNQAYANLLAAAGKAVDEDLETALAGAQSATNSLQQIVDTMTPKVTALAASEAGIAGLVGIATAALKVASAVATGGLTSAASALLGLLSS